MSLDRTLETTTTFVTRFFADLGYIAPVLVVLVLLIAALGWWIGRLEHWPPGDGLYFGFVTGTTVGYGDLRPTRPLSRLLAILVAIVGLMLTGTVVAVALDAGTHAFPL